MRSYSALQTKRDQPVHCIDPPQTGSPVQHLDMRRRAAPAILMDRWCLALQPLRPKHVSTKVQGFKVESLYLIWNRLQLFCVFFPAIWMPLLFSLFIFRVERKQNEGLPVSTSSSQSGGSGFEWLFVCEWPARVSSASRPKSARKGLQDRHHEIIDGMMTFLAG